MNDIIESVLDSEVEYVCLELSRGRVRRPPQKGRSETTVVKYRASPDGGR